jgi:hypothetical protein
MRSLRLEAAIWDMFTSTDFFESAAQECDDMVAWFGNLAVARGTGNFGRNGQIFDKFKKLAIGFRRGSELVELDDYRLLWDISTCFSGDVRGMMEQPLHSWMTESELEEFSNNKIGRLFSYTDNIQRALINAIWGADSFFNSDPDYAEQRNDDNGFPGDEIVEAYNDVIKNRKDALSLNLPEPLPEYKAETKITCRTGDEVPCTGVWYPSAGLDNYSLTFAIKGARMQAAYRVMKTKAQLEAEGIDCPYAETIIVATTWHPLIKSDPPSTATTDLWAKAGQPCPKAGFWQPTDPDVAPRAYQAGQAMANLGSTYGFTVWKWIADR